MTVVIDNAVPGPCTHALVIGVGNYTHAGWSVTPIDSAGHSALAFAKWLADSFGTNAKWPLATLDVLVSLPGAPAEFSGQPVEHPTTTHVFDAIKRWFTVCDAGEDDLAIFFFAGHGVEKGLAASLLMQNFGANAIDLGDDALNLDTFTLGMERCKARQQLFIVDACRNMPVPLLASLAQFGRAGVAPDANVVHALDRDHLVLKSTSASRKAYGLNGQPSRFTSALLKALDGAAWEDDAQPWTSWSVRSERLVTAVNYLLRMEEQLQQFPMQTARAGGNHAGFVLWESGTPPKVPVYITCKPTDKLPDAAFTVSRAGAVLVQRPASDGNAWEIVLDAAQAPYTISAAFAAAAAPVQRTLVVRPPLQKAEVDAP